ncbi:helix-turn-helix domain-containing protein [Phascolarctobacterium succinatutens]|uniref:helix-turn-helix domain-containing protein n=1 Tax=Phascolarctobacterium succinatutens TaxID=626940 RepID=UPI003AF0E359
MGDEMISEKAKLVGNRIKMMRLAKGLRQKHVADMLKISQSNMSNIESVRCGVTIDHLIILREIFACSMNDFFVDIEKSAYESSKRGYTVEDLLNIVAKIKG